MNNQETLQTLREKINQGKFPSEFQHFGGAELIITNNPNRKGHEYDTVVVTPHASAFSWLIIELKGIYQSQLDYNSKYEFYPCIGRLILEATQADLDVFDAMLYVVGAIEADCGG
jgi:hypothetical protein